MRILILTPHLGQVFGQEQVLADSSALLRGEGHEVCFVTDDLTDDAPKNEGLEIIAGLSGLHALTPRAQAEESLSRAWKFAEKIRPDLVHFIDQYDSRVVKMFGAKYPTVLSAHSVVHTCPASNRLIRGASVCGEKSGWSCLSHDLNYRCLNFKDTLRKAHAVQTYLNRRNGQRKVNAVIAASRYIKEILAHDGWDDEKISVVYNPVAIPKVSRPLENTPEGLITCAARLVPLKGIAQLLKALDGLRDLKWTLWIYGDGPAKADLEKTAVNLGFAGRVVFKGRAPSAEVHQAFAASRFVAAPSVGPEAFGLSAAEASALGTPVVAFDLPALNEVIHHEENGLLATPESISSLQNAMHSLLSDELRAKRLGKNGPGRISHFFSPKMHLQETLRVYQSITGHKVAVRASAR